MWRDLEANLPYLVTCNNIENHPQGQLLFESLGRRLVIENNVKKTTSSSQQKRSFIRT